MRAVLPRNRPLYILLAALVIATGLLWRSHFLPLPLFISKYGGDSFWALLVFLLFAIIQPRASTLSIAIQSLIFSFIIEFSQLYHAPWIDSLRSTRLGALILGSIFNWPDLLAYALGITIGAGCELISHHRKTRGQHL